MGEEDRENQEPKRRAPPPPMTEPEDGIEPEPPGGDAVLRPGEAEVGKPTLPSRPALDLPAREEDKPRLDLGPRPPAGPTPATGPSLPLPGGSARAAMDDLETKGLFLDRHSSPGGLPPRPPVRESSWHLFEPEAAPEGPLGSPPALQPAPGRRQPQDYTAGDLVYDRMTGAPTRVESFEDYTRRVARKEEPHRSESESLFPEGVLRLFRERQWERLIDGFQRVLHQDPGGAAAWAGLGICALAQDDAATATRLLDHALHLNVHLRLGALLADLLPTNPDGWLELAEGLAAAGWAEEPQELCNRVAADVDHPDSVRRQAQKLRHTLRLSRAVKAGTGGAPARKARPRPLLPRLATGTAVVLLLGLSIAAGLRLLSAWHVERGSNLLALGLHGMYRLGEGDPRTDRRNPTEGRLEAAMGQFDRALELNPQNLRAAFLRFKACEAALKLGLLRRGTPEAWDRARWEQARAAKIRAEKALEASPEALAREQDRYAHLEQAALEGEALFQ